MNRYAQIRASLEREDFTFDLKSAFAHLFRGGDMKLLRTYCINVVYRMMYRSKPINDKTREILEIAEAYILGINDIKALRATRKEAERLKTDDEYRIVSIQTCVDDRELEAAAATISAQALEQCANISHSSARGYFERIIRYKKKEIGWQERHLCYLLEVWELCGDRSAGLLYDATCPIVIPDDACISYQERINI